MPDQTETVKKQKVVYLDVGSIVRPYSVNEMDAVFQDMKGEMEAGDKEIVAKNFHDAALSVGTHAPKITSSRSKMRAMYLPSKGGNQVGRLAISGNSAVGKYAKVLLRPIAIIGQSGSECLFNRMISRSASCGALLDAFENVFGSEARTFLEEGMQERLRPAEALLWTENFPVFFLPGDAGGSMQAAPAGNIEALSNMSDLKWAMLKEAAAARKEKKKAVYGEWSTLSFSDNAQNLIIGAPVTRTKFRAGIPAVLNRAQADLWRFVKGGRFPQLRDEAVVDAIIAFAKEELRLSDRDEYRNGDILKGQAARARFICGAASRFIEEMLVEGLLLQEESSRGEESDVASKDLRAPSVIEVLSRAPIYRALRDRDDLPSDLTIEFVRQSLLSDRFRDVAADFEDITQ